MIKKILITLALTVVFSINVQSMSAYDGYSDYVLPDSSVSNITDSDLNGLSSWDLKVARNEIYARHGRAFKSSDLKCYFQNKNWYAVDPKYTDSRLNVKEVQNIQVILQYEKKVPGSVTYKDLGCKYGETQAGSTTTVSENPVEPDVYVLPYSDKQFLTDSDLRYLSYWQLKVARNEIFARHGRAFKSTDLKCYFSKQPWYKVMANYSYNLLNDYEKKNVTTILNLEKKIKSPVTYVDKKCGYEGD